MALLLTAGALFELAQAEDINFVNHTELSEILREQNNKIADLEARLADQPASFAPVSGVCDCGSNAGCQMSCNDCCCCDDCCSRAGFVGGAEILWLKAFQSEGNFGDFGYRTGYRAWAGWQRDDGLGVRVRYFDYFQRSNNVGDVFDVSMIDLEVFDSYQLGPNWNLLVGAGIRQMDYIEQTFDGRLSTGIHGLGPVATAELYRYFNDSFSLYAIGRESIIFGSQSGPGTGVDTTGNVLEMQLGAQANYDYGSSILVARVGWEAQIYNGVSQADSEAASLVGGVASIAVMR